MPRAAAELAIHDIDTDDLFALIIEAEPEPQPEAAQRVQASSGHGQGSGGSAIQEGRDADAR